MTDVVGLEEIGRTDASLVGGKAANLGELSRMDGVRVPPGVCVTTAAFERATAHAPAVEERLERLSRLALSDGAAIREASAEARAAVEACAIPEDVATAIAERLRRLGDEAAYAVRSSATAEDLPGASFAGQQDSYLNVVGLEEVLRHVRLCWGSLFTERAVTYRLRNGFDHRGLRMAVIVQRMIPAQVAGVLFTADPVSGHRKVAVVEAVFGLGEALVSGAVAPDAYRVRDGAVVERTIERDRRDRPTLTDDQAVRIAQLGRRIEARFGSPQDIEWCLAGDGLHVVQSRPITTLFPIPEAEDDENRVYVSVGHQQMMTEAMKPLGLSVWQLTPQRPMRVAGGRLFVDVTEFLGSQAGRASLLGLVGRSDPLIGDALRTIAARDFVRPRPEPPAAALPLGGANGSLDADPAIVEELVARSEASIAALKRDIEGRSGSDLLDFIVQDFEELRRRAFDPQSLQVILAGMEAAWWLSERLADWLGERNAADVLTQSVPNNVTSEMGLALLDVADAIRPHPEVVTFLRRVREQGFDDERFLDALAAIPGGVQARDALRAYLDRYGMRCVGEIDITRPRWSERPTALVPAILADVEQFGPGAAKERFERGRREAEQKRHEVLERLRALPDGDRKAAEAAQMIARVRTFAGYREYPKYAMVTRYFVYKRALLAEAQRLVSAGLLHEREDIYYLAFQELYEVVGGNRPDEELLQRRREQFRTFERLIPPRVLTSDGEVLAGSYRRDDVPAGALAGLAVSAGVVEGRARVALDMAQADLQAGDILVTSGTDPSWTPAFVAIAGLVTEVGGMMTHGAVIAREYGLPAVVGVDGATRAIRDGQRIRVHGTHGYVELLPDDGASAS